MQQALVTGANGFVGSALVRRLLKDGVRVRAMCRDAARGKALAEAGAEVVVGDVQTNVEPLAKGCDVVFHVAAVANGSAAYHYHVNVVGTQNVLQAAYRAGVGRFVHVSTIAIYGYNMDGLITEDHPQRPSRDYFYMESKALGEARVWDFSRKTGLPATVIRPGMIYGPGSTFWSRMLYTWTRQFGAPMVNRGQGNAHPIFIEDVTDLMVTLATHPNAPGYSFHATPDPAPTWAEFMGYYTRLSGNPATLHLPVAALNQLSDLVVQLTRLRGEPFDIAGTFNFWGSRATFSMSRAWELLEWRARTSLTEGMKLTEPWLQA